MSPSSTPADRRHVPAAFTSGVRPLLVLVLCLACAPDPIPIERIELTAGRLRGTLQHLPRNGAAFGRLEHSDFPGRSIYDPGQGGLNFEHILNGADRDFDLNWFTPRTDPHEIVRVSDRSAIVRHPKEASSWGVDSTMTYTFTGEAAVEMDFRVRLHEDRFPLGYVGFMWASYVQGALDRCIHFYGSDGERSGWMTFGREGPDGTFPMGVVPAVGATPLRAESRKLGLNVFFMTDLRFELPFYYGLLDGDGDEATTNDPMAYLMMFDQVKPIRLVFWNFTRDAEGREDRCRPAWDWQYVIESPEIGRRYGYRARMEYFPFRGREDVLRRYRAWRAGLPEKEGR